MRSSWMQNSMHVYRKIVFFRPLSSPLFAKSVHACSIYTVASCLGIWGFLITYLQVRH